MSRFTRFIERLRRVDYARLNHILIPTTSAERDKWRNTRSGRLFTPLFRAYEALTPAGRGYFLLLLPVGLFGLEVERTDVYVFWSALLSALLVSVAARWAFVMHGVQLEARAPARVAMGETVTFSLEFVHRGDRPYADVLLEGPFLPWDGHWQSRPPRVAILRAGARLTLTLSAKFRARGEHHLDPFTAAAIVPFGLAHGPVVRSRGVRFIVVPPIARVISVALPLRALHQPGGVPRPTGHGDAFDLRGLRPYRPGDPVRDLHARSWARTGTPIVREYQQEHFRRAAIIFDPELRPHSDPTLIDAEISLTLGLVSHLAREDLLVDLVLIGTRVHELRTTLSSGRDTDGLLGAAIELLACVKPGEPFDPLRVLAAVSPYAPGLSAVLIVTTSPGEAHTELSSRLASLGVPSRVVAVHSEIDDMAQSLSQKNIISLSSRAVLSKSPLTV